MEVELPPKSTYESGDYLAVLVYLRVRSPSSSPYSARYVVIVISTVWEQWTSLSLGMRDMGSARGAWTCSSTSLALYPYSFQRLGAIVLDQFARRPIRAVAQIAKYATGLRHVQRLQWPYAEGLVYILPLLFIYSPDKGRKEREDLLQEKVARGLEWLLHF